MPPCLSFQMPTTSPAGSRNVLRQLGVAPLPAPLTSALWLSRTSISSFRWVLPVQLMVGRETKWGWLPARKQGCLSRECEGVEQRHCPSLTPWFQTLGRLQTSAALWRFSGSVFCPGDFTYPGNSSVGLPLHDNRAVLRWLGWGLRLLKVKCLMDFDFK